MLHALARTPFGRLSFGARLVIASIVAALTPLAIAFVVLIELPARVADDSVKLELRETTGEVLSIMTEERTELRAELLRRVEDPAVESAILARDAVRLQAELADFRTGLEVVFPRRSRDDLGAGPLSASVTAFEGDRSQTAVVFRRIDDAVLAEINSRTEGGVVFAVSDGGDLLGTSPGFPEGVRIERLLRGGPSASGNAPVRVVDLEGTEHHVYIRSLSAFGEAYIVSLSTPQLEQAALAGPRSDVLRALGVLLLASGIFALLGSYAFNRALRRFADRANALARGNYDARLPVFGSDAFADLSVAFNSLAGELQERESELVAAARRFERTLETIDEGICVWDSEGDVIYWNRGAETLTGVSRTYVDDLDEPALAFLRGQLESGVRRVALPTRRSGGPLFVDLTVTRMPGGGMLQTFRDTTAAEMLLRTQRNFMATAAHELRTPLATILGFADTLANEDLELAPEQRGEFLGLIQGQARHLQRVTDAFFTNHQLAAERVDVALEAVDVAEAVRDGIRRATRVVGEEHRETITGVQVEVADGVYVHADRRALASVVAALVDNACKYGRPPMEIGCAVSGAVVLLKVRDHGGGIEPQHLERIFDPFYRVDVDMRDGVGGPGLGLYTVRKLVEAMHGTVRVESDPLFGTVFTVELPGHALDDGRDSQRLRAVG